MKLPFRLLVTSVTGISALFFVLWVGGALLVSLHWPLWLSWVLSLAAAVVAGRFVWTGTASVRAGVITSMVLGACVLGGAGFAVGFFGPILFMPEANQGPLLGIFITGPLGFVLGAIAGGIYWAGSGRRHPDPLL
jgi:hypothetical protein